MLLSDPRRRASFRRVTNLLGVKNARSHDLERRSAICCVVTTGETLRCGATVISQQSVADAASPGWLSSVRTGCFGPETVSDNLGTSAVVQFPRAWQDGQLTAVKLWVFSCPGCSRCATFAVRLSLPRDGFRCNSGGRENLRFLGPCIL